MSLNGDDEHSNRDTENLDDINFVDPEEEMAPKIKQGTFHTKRDKGDSVKNTIVSELASHRSRRDSLHSQSTVLSDINTMDRLMKQMTGDQSFGVDSNKRGSFKGMSNEEFFRSVLETWGLQETMLRQSIYFSFVGSHCNLN